MGGGRWLNCFVLRFLVGRKASIALPRARGLGRGDRGIRVAICNEERECVLRYLCERRQGVEDGGWGLWDFRLYAE